MSDLNSNDSSQVLAALIKIAIGTDTLDTYVDKSKVSKGMLSKLINSKATNTRRSTLEKIANANSNGIRLNDLLKYAGLPEDPTCAPGIEIPLDTQLNELRRIIVMRNIAARQTALLVAENYLISCGNTQFTAQYNDGEFTLKIDNKEYIGIPAFDNGKKLSEIVGAVISKVMKCTEEVKERISDILIVTGFPEVYDQLVSVFSDFTSKPTILYTNDNISVTKYSE